jgi:hypothetical protein
LRWLLGKAMERLDFYYIIERKIRIERETEIENKEVFGVSLSYGTKVRSISFAYFGTEIKPHGSLIISSDTLIYPSYQPGDALFGLGLQTDGHTLRNVEEFVYNNKYTSKNEPQKMEDFEGYVINDEFDQTYYLPSQDLQNCFRDLVQWLQEKGADKTAIEALKYYDSNWQNPNR